MCNAYKWNEAKSMLYVYGLNSKKLLLILLPIEIDHFKESIETAKIPNFCLFIKKIEEKLEKINTNSIDDTHNFEIEAIFRDRKYKYSNFSTKL